MSEPTIENLNNLVMILMITLVIMGSLVMILGALVDRRNKVIKGLQEVVDTHKVRSSYDQEVMIVQLQKINELEVRFSNIKQLSIDITNSIEYTEVL